ncbi:MAG TPA: aminotransferase class III-fold pyridoxal phosphate-dependent enzyme [Dehalococcoidia bacterium]
MTLSILERYVELHPASLRLHQRALPVFPDGVTHDMRQTSPFPLYVQHADRGRKTDVDGNEIIDFVMGHGALLLGHSHPSIVEAVTKQAALGTHYGASHELEIAWGERVQELVPSAEKVRFTSSGTEATMMALRLARAYTGREKVLRLYENFHGWNDSVTGQPAPEETVPRAAGLPHGTLDASIVIPQGDIATLERTIDEEGSAIAALIFEATGAHWGTYPLDLDYVRRARELTAAHGIVMIMDEVITGFRVTPGGAQQAYGVTPDLTTMAKILGGGLPGGAVAGKQEIIDQISIARARAGMRVSHPGTYNANPLSAAAGSTCLEIVADGSHQDRAAATSREIARGMNAALREASMPGAVYGQSSMLHISLGECEQPPDGYGWGWRALPAPLAATSAELSQALRLGMLNEGVDLMGGGLMVSSAHTSNDADRTLSAFRRTLDAIKAERLV